MNHVWFVIRWLHVLAMAFFVGGQLMLAAVVVPVARGLESREPLRAMARRFGTGTLIAFAVLLATGVAMAQHLDLWGDSTFQVKLGLVVLVAVLIVLHLRRPNMHVLDALIFLLSLAIVWLGLYLANGWS